MKFLNVINSLLSLKFLSQNVFKDVFLDRFTAAGYNCGQVFLSGEVLFGESDLGFGNDCDSLQKFEPNYPSATEQNRFVTKHVFTMCLKLL